MHKLHVDHALRLQFVERPVVVCGDGGRECLQLTMREGRGEAMCTWEVLNAASIGAWHAVIISPIGLAAAC